MTRRTYYWYCVVVCVLWPLLMIAIIWSMK